MSGRRRRGNAEATPFVDVRFTVERGNTSEIMEIRCVGKVPVKNLQQELSSRFGVPPVHTWILPNEKDADEEKTLLELIDQHSLPQGYGPMEIIVVRTSTALT